MTLFGFIELLVVVAFSKGAVCCCLMACGKINAVIRPVHATMRTEKSVTNEVSWLAIKLD